MILGHPLTFRENSQRFGAQSKNDAGMSIWSEECTRGARGVIMKLNPAEHRRQSLRNFFQSLVIFGGVIGLMSLIAWLLMGLAGVLLALAIGVLFTAIGPQVAPSLVLRLYGAQEVDSRTLWRVRGVISELTGRAGLRKVPKLYYVPSSVPNAFTVGRRDRGAIAVTDGLLRSLDMRELAAVLAHEIAHLRNDDLRVMHAADMFGRMTRILSHLGVMLLVLSLVFWLVGGPAPPVLVGFVLLFAPLFGDLLQLALSRAREFEADLDAVELTGDPTGLSLALRKLEWSGGGIWNALFPWLATRQPSLMRSHPSSAERIRRLNDLSTTPESRRAEKRTSWAGPITDTTKLPVIFIRPRRRLLSGLWV